VNQRVQKSECVACAAGMRNGPGNDPNGGDTTCAATTCPANQYVQNHACVPCVAGTTNAAGDDASGGDTTCDAIVCDEAAPLACATYDLRAAVEAWLDDACAAVARYGPVETWDVSCAVDTSDLFKSAGEFNADLGAWAVSSVTSFRRMFGGAAAFNADLSAWDVSSATSTCVLRRFFSRVL
jgi:surface protein